MATISKQTGYMQGINLTGGYAWLMNTTMLRKTTSIRNPSSSDVHVVRRLEK